MLQKSYHLLGDSAPLQDDEFKRHIDTHTHTDYFKKHVPFDERGRQNLSAASTHVPRRSTIYPGNRPACRQLKMESMAQANLTCGDVSYYGSAVPKIPQSFVLKMAALKRNISNKTSTYNFQGSLHSNSRTTMRRQWILPFAQTYFSDADVLKITDAPANHISLGPYDHTDLTSDSYRPKDHPKGDRLIPFDVEYYHIMAQSTFTLCPGGDAAWSMRFYEAILAGSIPLIHSEFQDFNGMGKPFWFDRIGYTYYTTSQVLNMKANRTELESIADQNYKLLLTYQTWVQGDQVPPAYLAFRDPCRTYPECMGNCTYFG